MRGQLGERGLAPGFGLDTWLPLLLLLLLLMLLLLLLLLFLLLLLHLLLLLFPAPPGDTVSGEIFPGLECPAGEDRNMNRNEEIWKEKSRNEMKL